LDISQKIQHPFTFLLGKLVVLDVSYCTITTKLGVVAEYFPLAGATVLIWVS